MNVMNTSGDELPECPLCMEPLEVDDLSFFPCTCGYQICRFCWHRIRTDENELCPACRKAYPENPADFKPLTQEQISALKAEKRQRDQQRKQKITENRKHLANVRVVQKNLVFVVGLPPRLADAEILKKHEYFGKYGKIHKVVINPSTTYAGVQGPSASAYVTYVHNNDALRAIQSVNNITIDGRSIKTSLGTTKYCSHFMKNQVCPKPDCMYLHELGDSEASFTKEEMHQGKHQEYEKRLHDALIAQMQQQSQQGVAGSNPSSTSPIAVPTVNSVNGSSGNGIMKSGSLETKELTSNGGNNGTVNSNGQIQKEAWPSLSTSPVTIKENKTSVKGNGNHKENLKNEANRKHEKVKEKSKSTKSQKTTNSSNNHSSLRDKNKINHTQSNINNNLDDDQGETDSDDTPSISSSTTDSGTVSESDSGKCSPPSSFPDPPIHHTIQTLNNSSSITTTSTSAEQQQLSNKNLQNEQQTKSIISSSNSIIDTNDITSLYTNSSTNDKVNNSILKDSGNLADTSTRLSKLTLFDDNSSFFSRNSFLKHDSTDHSHAMTNAQLPDLLNGTLNNSNSMGLDSKQILKNLGSFGSSEPHDDWESAFKYIMSKNSFNKHYDEQQQEDWLRFQELRKHPMSSTNSGVGLNQFNNMFNNDNNIDNMFTQNEINRVMFNNQYSQQQQQQQQQRMNHNTDLNHVHPNMSKFFDFHKQQQQNQFIMNSNPLTDQLNMANLLDNHHRMNQNSFMDQNGLSHLQKQRLMNNKYDGNNMPFSNSQQQNRMHNNPSQFSVEDDLGFDPIKESHKGLSELINDEVLQQQQMNSNNSQRSRMPPPPPPPGFNHLQSSGFNFGSAASPRTQTGSKFPFVNMQGSTTQNNWPMHMGFQNQNNSDAFSHQTNNQHKSAGFGNNFSDWTSMDPAIVSFRQFSQFNPQQQQPPQQQQAQNQPNNDMFMSQMNQQGFGHHGMNMQNNLQSQTSPAQVFSHSNLLNNYHMNNLANGFPNNSFDKFSMPSIPPGFQQGNGNNKKAECIN
ncbi:GATA zinc finger domain-containing protein 14 isoform X1 [Chironomus tepperi]|uniref:GATA zinc finger domain-containing protein 14 isoform X1 n=1 Tax=Chironomus tepperi TaxID=113505 RepID=UPI00391FB0D9